jgi:hypothetical protein
MLVLISQFAPVPLGDRFIQPLGHRAEGSCAHRLIEQPCQGLASLPSGNAAQKHSPERFIHERFAPFVAWQNLWTECSRAASRHLQLEHSKTSRKTAPIKAIGLIDPIPVTLIGMGLQKKLPLLHHQHFQKPR